MVIKISLEIYDILRWLVLTSWLGIGGDQLRTVNLGGFFRQFGLAWGDGVGAKKPESHTDAGDAGLWNFTDLEKALFLDGIEHVGGFEVIVLHPVLTVEMAAGPAELVELPTIKNTIY